MKKISPISKYLIEKAAGGFEPADGMKTGPEIAGFGDQGIFSNVIVKNPQGDAFDDKRKNFGLGFDMTPALAQSVMDVVKTHGDSKDKADLGLDKEEGPDWDTDDPNNPYENFATWQQINRAVGNYVTSKSNIAMEPFRMGKVPKNPIGRYDGFHSEKIGIISEKPGRKARSR